MYISFRSLIFVCAIGIYVSCSEEKLEDGYAWTCQISNLGSSSSARAIDLNNDGILDIVLGLGKLEFEHSDTAILAINGRNGAVLWTHPGIDQIFGSPIFLDINADTIPDVFIGGRSGQMMCLDGRTGGTIWQIDTLQLVGSRHPRVLNFYNLQFVPDHTGDGHKELLCAYGGDVMAAPSQKNRVAGRLLILNGYTGALLHQSIVPDSRETYMSPLMHHSRSAPRILFGSGGETIGGHLFHVPLTHLFDEDLDSATILASSASKGFIAPPSLVDINGDGINDIIVNSVDGRSIAIDGDTGREIWSIKIDGTEAYSMPAIGFFNDDEIPDVFATFGIGQFPDLSNAVHVALDGRDGNRLYQDTLGIYHYGSAVAYDVDEDGEDEIIYHANVEEMGLIKNGLKIIDVAEGSITDLSPMFVGANNGSTPLLLDLDGNKFLDIVMVHENDPYNVLSTESKVGVTIRCIQTQIKCNKPIRWGAYMGSNYNGIF